MKKAVLLDVDGAVIDSVHELYCTTCAMWLGVFDGQHFPLAETEFTAERPNITTMVDYFIIITRILEGRGTGVTRTAKELNGAFYETRKRRMATEKAVWLGENRLYPGIKEMLEGLKTAGITVAVVSSKNEAAIRELFEHHGIIGFIDGGIVALEKGGREQQFIMALDNLGATPSDALAYDDARANLVIAQKMGIIPVGAPQGYGKPIEFEGFETATPRELPCMAKRLFGI